MGPHRAEALQVHASDGYHTGRRRNATILFIAAAEIELS
jgi:hypothetical protein